MSGADLYIDLQAKVAALSEALKAYRQRGELYARAEHDYRVAMAQKILEERDKGMPVTIISDVCRGHKNIAKLRLERDIAEVIYKSAFEAIQAIKLQIKILESQIQREFGG